MANVIAVRVFVSLALMVDSVNVLNVISIVIPSEPIVYAVNVFVSMVGRAIVVTVKKVLMAVSGRLEKFVQAVATVSAGNACAMNLTRGNFVKLARRLKISCVPSMNPV